MGDGVKDIATVSLKQKQHGELIAPETIYGVAKVIAEGKSVTYDLKPDPKDPTAVGTSQMADAIIKIIRQ